MLWIDVKFIWDELLDLFLEEVLLCISVSWLRVYLILNFLLNRLWRLSYFAFSMCKCNVWLKLESLNPRSPICLEVVAAVSSFTLVVNLLCLEPRSFCDLRGNLLGCILQRIHCQWSEVHGRHEDNQFNADCYDGSHPLWLYRSVHVEAPQSQ